MTLLVGVDVQGGELIVAFRRDGVFLPPAVVVVSAEEVRDHILYLRQNMQEKVVVAIDAPRRYLVVRRRWRLNDAGVWFAADLAWGRHCEVVVRRMGLANPQWTPPATQPLPWITLGQRVFTTCEAAGLVAIECFPTASYTRLGQMDGQELNIPGRMFAHSRLAHDILDASVAALTADLFVAGNATELGGGDGLGTIVVPGIIQVPFPAWPNV
jgi:predicted nuclease with RNAse H fold